MSKNIELDNINLRVLLICDYRIDAGAAVVEHINAFMDYSIFDVYVYSNMGNISEDINLDNFDVVIIHYSVFVGMVHYFPPRTRRRLRSYKGLKCVFVQDDYRMVNNTIDALNEMQADILFTVVPENKIESIYPKEACGNMKFFSVLTGYFSNELKYIKSKPLSQRKYDVGYRGRVYPLWHGEAGREKYEIGKRFKKDAGKYGLKCNIKWNEKNRIYCVDWVNFIRNCKAVLALQSNAGVIDRDGNISLETEAFVDLTIKREGLFNALTSLLKKDSKYKEDISKLSIEDKEFFYYVKEKYFKNIDGNISLATISPRIFEAVALRTLLILYEGEYMGLLEPWKNYVPLKRDHSNMDEVVRALNDHVLCSEIIARTYSQIATDRTTSYPGFINLVDNTISKNKHLIKNVRVEKIERRNLFNVFKFSLPYHVKVNKYIDILSKVHRKIGKYIKGTSKNTRL